MRAISNDKANNIYLLLRSKKSNSEIAKQIGVSRTTVQKYRSSLKMSRNVDEGGRPSLISQPMVNYIRRLVTLGRKNNAVKIQKALKEEFGISVSDSTVRRVLKKAGFIAFVKSQKPLLRSQNIVKRLQWAKSHQHWTVDDWKRVIFSDETKVNRFASDGKAYAWKLPHEELNSPHVQQTVKHGGGNIMVWSCITWEGVGWIVDVGHRMNSEGYLEVLKDDLLKTMKSYGLDSSKMVFQQDNDPKHTSKVVKEWISQQPLEALEWPPQSPDLSPIEHMWAHLKRELFHSYEAPPSSMHELWERIGQTWYAISKEECQKYIESMPKRCVAVIKAKDRWTKY
ncbi:hypothetical protein RO3G_04690 [Rhizopus delemar RA 99-880]|uniref:Tc1-like transposase DDE domain-containing protein n=1 Tax=Rhizopus delemar (strain RA 99-880 / ATCC MYA-4621 / FGSC 9543 / NRRL 43880) TaxID=246409 RepID=I1BUV5_RHIO9|nr:hypothetical protein RO3G_04690 [Rhizopus delemar RA 99-880]|eukprot:EIE79985.1 hypothetical protein RO3G_04690 [Rhizopus delemar RA 99-880]